MIEPNLLESRILLVDDEPGAIRVMRSLLSDFLHLTFARSGAEALRQIRASRPDLVIVDINMPGMSGLQLCEQLQADPELKDLPVIVATAEQLTSVESAALQRGAVDFVTKPLVPETFIARVRCHLRARELAERVHQSVAGSLIASAPSQAPARLLIVDDDVGAITLLQRTLADLGTIHYATTGAEALRLSHEIRPDLVMLDVHMPGLDGFAVCAALKAQQEFKHVPVVFVTRFGDAANEQRALDLGAADFVRKPIESSVLRARVRNLLALKARIDGELRALSEHWRRLADARVADVVRTAGDGVVSCDASEHVLLANAAAALLLGKPGESLVGMALNQLLPNFAPLLELALAMPVQLTVPGPNDRARPLEIRASRSEDRLLLTLVIRDISEREQLETEQRARAVAEAAAQAKSRLLAFVNHEMGAPLNAVLGFSEVMGGDDLNPLPPAQLARLGRIVEGAQQAQHLMADLMDWSRHEAGKLSVDLGPVDAEACLRQAIESARPAAERAGVELMVAEPASVEPVLADRRRLVQCITNLLTNAIKYNRKGGSVRAELSRLGSDVRLDVRDQGIGMTTAQLTHLFEPFNRLGLETSALPGTGLGLVITKGLIEAMQGSLLVESMPGQGTRFSIVLRVAAR